MAIDSKRVREAGTRHFGVEPDILTRAPGRVNLIGEHTDYNAGFVLPATVDFDVVMSARARDDNKLLLYSIDYDQSAETDYARLHEDRHFLWVKYVAGVADQLLRRGYALRGAEIAFSGDVPRGSGLSSSAAVEMAAVTAFCEMNHLDIAPVERVKIAQKAENEFVGVPCGIMDQFISGLGAADSALFIDCRSYDYRHVPLDLSDTKIVICDSQKKRSLAASAYAQRCKECAEGVRRLSELLGRPIEALREVEAGEFANVEDQIPSPIRERCRHVITENDRVLQAIDALELNKLEVFGELMNASHASLRDDYEVSCEELNTICEAGNQVEGELGSRMTGAGFGGCTVHLVKTDAVEDFRNALTRQYYAPRDLEPTIYVCASSPGAGLVDGVQAPA